MEFVSCRHRQRKAVRVTNRYTVQGKPRQSQLTCWIEQGDEDDHLAWLASERDGDREEGVECDSDLPLICLQPPQENEYLQVRRARAWQDFAYIVADELGLHWNDEWDALEYAEKEERNRSLLVDILRRLGKPMQPPREPPAAASE